MLQRVIVCEQEEDSVSQVEMRLCHWTLAVGDDAGPDARVAKWRNMVALAPPLRIRPVPPAASLLIFSPMVLTADMSPGQVL